MSEAGTADLVTDGSGQAVRLPDEFRLPGTQVRVRKVGSGLMLEPIARRPEDIKALLDELQRLARLHGPFMPEGRDQPPMPTDDDMDMFDPYPI